MNSSYTLYRKRIVIVFLLLLFVCIGCLADGPNTNNDQIAVDRRAETSVVMSTLSLSKMPTTVNKPSQTPHETAPTEKPIENQTVLSSQTPIPTTTSTQTKTPTPTIAPINDTGPWFVYYSEKENAYVAVNEDGSGKSTFFSNIMGRSLVVGSANNLLAIVTEWPELEKEYPYNLAMVILGLPDGKVKQIIPLLSHEDTPSDYLVGIDLAVTYKSAAWSPNGRYLAFIGATDGPTADLYLYDSFEEKYTRLSIEPNRASNPQWSPDGNWIIYNESENIGGMCDSLAVWAAAVDTNEVRKLFGGGCSPDILAWVGMESFVSIDHPNGRPMNLIAVSLDKGLVVKLLPENSRLWNFYEQIGINLERQEIVYSVSNPGPDSAEVDGTYIFSFTDPEPKRLSETYFMTTLWMSGIERYIAYPDIDKCGVITFSSGGEFTCLQDDDYAFVTLQNNGSFLLDAQDLSVSPNGEWLVISSDSGLYFYDREMNSTKVKDKKGKIVGWMPDSSGFLFADKSLYSVELSTLNIQKVRSVNNTFTTDIFWNSTMTGFFIFADESLDYFNFVDYRLSHIDKVNIPMFTWVGK